MKLKLVFSAQKLFGRELIQVGIDRVGIVSIQKKTKNKQFFINRLEMIGLEVIGLEMIELEMIGLEMIGLEMIAG